MSRAKSPIVIASALFCFTTGVQAAVTISTGTTSKMKCSAGVCSPAFANAVLNVGDLENLLASGSIVVTTTGNGVQAKDILVSAALTWSSSNTLTLDAYRSLAIGSAVSVTGAGGMSLLTNDGGSGGTLSFAGGSNISFSKLSSALSINGASYTLVNSVQMLASDIAANPSSDFALTQNYDASGDGTYSASPIGTQYGGIFEALGNAISNLTINDTGSDSDVALFSYIQSGSVRDLNLDSVSVTGGSSSSFYVGGIAARIGSGMIWGSHVSGTVSGGEETGGLAGEAASGTISYATSSARVSPGSTLGSAAGGLVGVSSATISNCYSTGLVTGGVDDYVAGLVGFNDTGGFITLSFATGGVTGAGGGSEVGGLVGQNQVGSGASITNSYATGAVNDSGGGTASNVGGLIGIAGLPAATSYSSGKVLGGQADVVGGFVGYDNTSGQMSKDYWDTTTSKIKKKSQGAGNIANDIGIKGLANKKFTSGLPKGFNPNVWTETAGINHGQPYLISNPPPK